jgi:hypothetical protein
MNEVTETNRFLTLKLLLERLSGHVGRRQYKMRSDLTEYFELLRDQEKLDWHEIKFLNRREVLELCDRLQMPFAARTVLLVAVESKICGVLTRSDAFHSESLCMRPGVAEHGWRCGKNGHSTDVYFEAKPKANPTALQLLRKSNVVEKKTDRGVNVEVRRTPDFSILGRIEPDPHPRVWRAPKNPMFGITTIGFEFRVHPDDPRAGPQIVEAAEAWKTHAEVVKHVLWEMLEMYGVERRPQPLDIYPGELGEPDDPYAHTAAFMKRQRRSAADAPTEGGNGDISASDVTIEPRIKDAGGREQPWFLPPVPQGFRNGVPEILPFAPTVIVRGTMRPVSLNADAAEQDLQILHPVLDVDVLVHPAACFWLSGDDDATCMGHVVEYAKKVPFAVPFNLYLRVDLAKELSLDGDVPNHVTDKEHPQTAVPTRANLKKIIEERLAEKSNGFNPSEFIRNERRRASMLAGQTTDSYAPRADDTPEELMPDASDVNPPGWV